MKSKLALFLCLMAALAATVIPCDAAKSITLTGVWTGMADLADGTEFSTLPMTLTVTEQRGDLFNGTMGFGNGIPFSISGAITADGIRITGSESMFEARVLKHQNKLFLVGSGSKLEVSDSGFSTVTFSLSK